MKPVIAITMGDPAGVGPEIILKALSKKKLAKKAHWVVLGDKARLESHPLKIKFNTFSPFLWQRSILSYNTPTHSSLLDFRNVPRNLAWGRATKQGGKASIDYIDKGVDLVQQKEVDALVTCPINKEATQKAGWGKHHKGHTEYLATLTGAKFVSLMMMNECLRVVHVTSHIPLSQVASQLTSKKIQKTIQLAHQGMKDWGIPRPRIAVCGLNPHAGDGGFLGKEELSIIAPAIRACRSKGIRVSGPYSSDTLWPRVRDDEFDVGIAMYHDQGQIPIKYESFQSNKTQQVNGINVTLGLPIIRTSVAHGTAYPIAGKMKASEESLADAMESAICLVESKK